MIFSKEFLYLHTIVEAQAQANPHAPALCFGDSQMWSYADINNMANNLAETLQMQGVKLETRVAMYVPRSAFQVIIFLAISKLGAVYIPFARADAHNRPIATLKSVAATCQPFLVIADKTLQQEAEAIFVHNQQWLWLNPETLSCAQAVPNFKEFKVPAEKRRDIYIIFSSGTTANPKGIRIQNTPAFCAWAEKMRAHYSEVSSVLSIIDLGFDAHLWEYLKAWLFGVPLYIATEEMRRDPEKLYYYLMSQHISHVVLLPKYLRQVLGGNCRERQIRLANLERAGLKSIDYTGQAMDLELVNLFQDSTIQLNNGFGSTEETLGSSLNRVINGDVSIGKPIRGVIYLLAPPAYTRNNLETITAIKRNDFLWEVKKSFSSELSEIDEEYRLIVLSPYLTQGYLGPNQQDRNESTFFAINIHGKSYQAYYTDDRVALTRSPIDQQYHLFARGRFSEPKIGDRFVNLDEIEDVVRQHLEQRFQHMRYDLCAVHHHTVLILYVVTEEAYISQEVSAEILNVIRGVHAPLLAISYLVFLDALPVNPSKNGSRDFLKKYDLRTFSQVPWDRTGKLRCTRLVLKKDELPSLEILANPQQIGPQYYLEHHIYKIFKEVLSLEVAFDITDSFDYLGGDSLSRAMLYQKIECWFGFTQNPFFITLLENLRMAGKESVQGIAELLLILTAYLSNFSRYARDEENKLQMKIGLVREGLSTELLPVLFCMPALFGGINEYTNNLNVVNRPIYFLRHPGLSKCFHLEHDPEFPRLPEDILSKTRIIQVCNDHFFNHWQDLDLQQEALYLAAIIKKIQPQGPYNLFGWSYGGLMITALAHEFIARGEEIDYFGMVDSAPPGHLRQAFEQNQLAYFQGLAALLQNLAQNENALVNAPVMVIPNKQYQQWFGAGKSYARFREEFFAYFLSDGNENFRRKVLVCRSNLDLSYSYPPDEFAQGFTNKIKQGLAYVPSIDPAHTQEGTHPRWQTYINLDWTRDISVIPNTTHLDIIKHPNFISLFQEHVDQVKLERLPALPQYHHNFARWPVLDQVRGNVIVFTGSPGCGKTTCALDYADQWLKAIEHNHRHRLIYSINLGSDLEIEEPRHLEKILDGEYVFLLEQLQKVGLFSGELEHEPLNQTARVRLLQKLRRTLSKITHVLLIYDNLKEIELFRAYHRSLYLQQQDSNHNTVFPWDFGKILITTRQQALGRFEIQKEDVTNRLTEATAANLLDSITELKDLTGARRLFNALEQPLVLDIVLAGHYIRSCQRETRPISYNDYVEKIQLFSLTVLETHIPRAISREETLLRTRKAVFGITFQAMQNAIEQGAEPFALNFIQFRHLAFFIACLHGGKIRQDMMCRFFKEYLDEAFASAQIEEFVHQFIICSTEFSVLILFDEKTHIYYMHPSLQEYIRGHYADVAATALESSAKLFAKLFYEIEQHDSYQTVEDQLDITKTRLDYQQDLAAGSRMANDLINSVRRTYNVIHPQNEEIPIAQRLLLLAKVLACFQAFKRCYRVQLKSQYDRYREIALHGNNIFYFIMHHRNPEGRLSASSSICKENLAWVLAETRIFLKFFPCSIPRFSWGHAIQYPPKTFKSFLSSYASRYFANTLTQQQRSQSTWQTSSSMLSYNMERKYICYSQWATFTLWLEYQLIKFMNLVRTIFLNISLSLGVCVCTFAWSLLLSTSIRLIYTKTNNFFFACVVALAKFFVVLFNAQGFAKLTRQQERRSFIFSCALLIQSCLLAVIGSTSLPYTIHLSMDRGFFFLMAGPFSLLKERYQNSENAFQFTVFNALSVFVHFSIEYLVQFYQGQSNSFSLQIESYAIAFAALWDMVCRLFLVQYLLIKSTEMPYEIFVMPSELDAINDHPQPQRNIQFGELIELENFSHFGISKQNIFCKVNVDAQRQMHQQENGLIELNTYMVKGPLQRVFGSYWVFVLLTLLINSCFNEQEGNSNFVVLLLFIAAITSYILNYREPAAQTKFVLLQDPEEMLHERPAL